MYTVPLCTQDRCVHRTAVLCTARVHTTAWGERIRDNFAWGCPPLDTVLDSRDMSPCQSDGSARRCV